MKYRLKCHPTNEFYLLGGWLARSVLLFGRLFSLPVRRLEAVLYKRINVSKAYERFHNVMTLGTGLRGITRIQ